MHRADVRWFPEYALGHLTRKRAPGPDETQRIAKGLVAAMSGYKVEGYFEAKPTILSDIDHLVVAITYETGEAVAVLATRWHDLPDASFLHLSTILIGNRYQKTHLIKRMFASLYLGLKTQPKGLPCFVVLKTYNPISYQALWLFTRIPGVRIHPDIPRGVCHPDLDQLAPSIAGLLNPGLTLQRETGAIRGGAGGVPLDFYPSLPRIRNQAVYEYFSRYLTPADRLLGILSISTEEAQQRILKSLGLRPGGTSTLFTPDATSAAIRQPRPHTEHCFQEKEEV
jgi:hypothetical protein